MKTLTREAIKTGLIGALAILGLSACAYMPGSAPNVEADFGNSVRNMVRAQTYDPHTAENPQEGITEGLDGNKAGVGLDGYRKDAGRVESVKTPIKSVTTQ